MSFQSAAITPSPADTVACHFHAVASDPIDFTAISVRLRLKDPPQETRLCDLRWITAPLCVLFAVLSVFLLSKIFFKASGKILCCLNILTAITLLPAERFLPARDCLLSTLLCALLALTLREYGTPLFFGVAICVYPALGRMLGGRLFVFSVFLAGVWAAVLVRFGIRARTAESPNVAGYGAAFALITLFLIVLRWNERQPTPDPVLFAVVASLFVLLLTVLGWPTDKLSEYSIFAPADKEDTPGTSLID
jgi:hypothetical protein